MRSALRLPILLGLIVVALAAVILIGAAAVQVTGDIRMLALGVFAVGLPAAGIAAWHELRQKRRPEEVERGRKDGSDDDERRLAA